MKASILLPVIAASFQTAFASPFNPTGNSYETTVYESPAKDSKSYSYTIQSAGKDASGNICGTINIVDKKELKNLGFYDYKSVPEDKNAKSFTITVFNRESQKEAKWRIIEDGNETAITIIINNAKYRAVKKSSSIATNREIESARGTGEARHAYLEPLKAPKNAGYATARISSEKKKAIYRELEYSFNPFSEPGVMWRCAYKANDGTLVEITFLAVGKLKNGNVHGIREFKATDGGRTVFKNESEYEVTGVDEEGYTLESSNDKYLVESGDKLWIGNSEYSVFDRKNLSADVTEQARRETEAFKLGK